MSNLHIYVTGIDATVARLGALEAEALAKAAAVTEKAAWDIQKHAQNNHPWQNDTGNLESRILAKSKGPFKWEVRAATNYAVFLEMGTSKMPPYPYMQPAVDAIAPGYQQALGSLL